MAIHYDKWPCETLAYGLWRVRQRLKQQAKNGNQIGQNMQHPGCADTAAQMACQTEGDHGGGDDDQLAPAVSRMQKHLEDAGDETNLPG